MTTETETENSESQARAQLDSVRALVARLTHAQECRDEDECGEVDDATIRDGLQLVSGDPATVEERRQYHDEDEARQAIEEDVLSVEVRTDWHTPGDEDQEADEYRLLLCTGGPAVQIIGTLTEHAEPDSARIQHQDWGTPWTNAGTSYAEDDDLLTFARCFYFEGG